MNIDGSKGIFIGGASGMCRATAIKFAEKGGQIAILDMEQSNGAEVAKELGGSFHVCNVMDFEGIEGVIGKAVEELGGLHYLVNTAGGGVAQRTLARDGKKHSLDDFRRIIDLNHTASIAAFEGQIGQVAYTAAKGGIAAMTLTMARDLGPLGIRTMTIAPSLFDTGLTAGIPDEGALQLTKDAAFPKRMGQPHEFATMAIAIFESPMMNGSTIRVDGGQRFAPR